MLARMPHVTYIEGFAGPGVYEGGEPGSPIIALRTLRAAAAPDKPVDAIFIDREAACLRRLKAEIDRQVGLPVRPLANDPVLVHGNAADELIPQLDRVRAWRGGIFAFLDSWGNVAVPLDVVRRLARPGCEVFVTLGRRFWRQFGTALAPEWDDMFGSDEWRAVAKVPGAAAQARFIADQYRRALRSVGFRYLLDFELVDVRGEYLYLVHATTNERGVEKMKEALWAVDPVAGTGFQDPRGQVTGQELLALEWQPAVTPLRRDILDWLVKGPMTVEDIKRRTALETVYKPSHATTAVGTLVAEGSVRRSPPSGRLVGSVVIERA